MKKTKLRQNKKLFLIIVAVLYLLPLLVRSEYLMRIGVLSCIYAILACSLNLIAGVCGQVSMGHAAFYGIGAYASALISMKFGLPWLVCLLIAFMTAGIFGIAIGIPALRLQGGYLAICTVGFGELIRLTMLNWVSLTRGPMGLVNIPRPNLFGLAIRTNKQYFYIALTLFILSYVILSNLIHSKFGRNLKAIKNDDTAAESMGIHVHKHKVTAFALAAAFAGVAGSMLAHYLIFIDPNVFISNESTTILSMVVFGGMGSMPGAAIAAALLTALPEALRSFSQYRMLIYGLLLIFMMLAKTFDWKTSRLYQFISGIRQKSTRKVSNKE